ncbi:MAG: hypothetical protein AAFO98_13650, partial [Pseudomonadota bacterium]
MGTTRKKGAASLDDDLAGDRLTPDQDRLPAVSQRHAKSASDGIIAPNQARSGAGRHWPGFPNLGAGEATLGRLSQTPRWTVYAFCLGSLLAAWAWMAVLAAGSVSVFDPVRGTVDLGPGTSPLMPMLDWLSQRTADSPLLQFLVQLCTPAVPQVDTVFQGIVVFSTMA